MTKKQTTIESLSELPTWVDPEAWAGFVAMRKTIKKPMTARAERLILAKLDEMRGRGHSPNDALDESTVQCWAGVFEPKQATGVRVAQQSSFRQADASHRNDRYAEMTGQAPKPAENVIDMKEVRDVRRIG